MLYIKVICYILFQLISQLFIIFIYKNTFHSIIQLHLSIRHIQNVLAFFLLPIVNIGEKNKLTKNNFFLFWQGYLGKGGDVLNKWDYYTPLVNVLSVCACVGDALTVLSESLEYCNFCPQFVCYVWFEVWQRHSGQKYYKNK